MIKTNLMQSVAFAAATEGGAVRVEETFATKAQGEALLAKAERLAKAEGKATSETTMRLVKAKADWDGAPFAVLKSMTEDYGESIHDFPDPSSESGNNPAKVKYKMKVNGKDKTVTVDFYITFSDTTKEGAAIVQEITWTKRAGDPEANKEGIPAHILAMNPVQRGQHLTFLEGKRKNIRNCHRKAMELHWQFVKFQDLPHVTATPIYTDDSETEVMSTTKPIRICNPKKPLDEYDDFSITNFLKVDVDRAIELGGDFAAVKKTLERQGGNGQGGDSASKPQRIATVDTFAARINDVHGFMDEIWSDTDKSKYTALLKVLGPKGPAGSDDFALSCYRIYRMLGDIYRQDAIRARAERLDETDVTSDDKTAAA